VKLGIALPTAGSTVNADLISTVAETAERIGLDSPVWFGWDALEGTVHAFRAAAAEAGHDPAALPVVVRVNQFPAAGPTADGASPTGSPEQIAEAIPRLERIGVTEVLWNVEEGPVEEQLPRLAELVGAPV
jgi:alkanesulfonate monooxygenase SsuD/methylene tetrahydromethanopterin reductase-like flavin-dependent oxidoreductase (luciferase family)